MIIVCLNTCLTPHIKLRAHLVSSPRESDNKDRQMIHYSIDSCAGFEMFVFYMKVFDKANIDQK